MADPVIVPCPVDAWTKVVTNKTTGVIHILKVDPDVYMQTYRDTGGATPTTVDEGVPFDSPLQISAAAAIDVYIRPKGKAGSVRVDL